MGDIHVVAEGRIRVADELDARAMLEATGNERGLGFSRRGLPQSLVDHWGRLSEPFV